MTKTCGFGNHPATNVKIDTEPSYDSEGIETVTKVMIPICEGCDRAYYDGTEDYPGLLPLA
jgi:hypothetical protein